MVVALGPGKFYGSSLPRPRYYTDVKLNEERVDPPMPVLEPLLSWANDAHWSMGGLSFQRHRLQGKIEGNINRLRAQREDIRSSTKSKINSKIINSPPPPQKFAVLRDDPEKEEEEEEEEEEEQIFVVPVKRKRARKLIDEFNKVASSVPVGESLKKPQKASENVVVSKRKREIVMEMVASRTRSSFRLEKGKDKEQERTPKERMKRAKAKKSC